jgi:hypothetical protein
MDTRNRDIVKQVLSHYAELRPSHGDIRLLVAINAASTILDAGCGWSRFTWPLIENYIAGRPAFAYPHRYFCMY